MTNTESSAGPMNEDTIQLGESKERGSIRVHYMATGVKVTDLTNAGKRGKVCREIWISRPGMHGPEMFRGYALLAIGCQSIEAVEAGIRDLLEDFPGEITIDETTHRGIDTSPAGYAMTIRTPDVLIDSEWDSFRVCDLNDTANEPRAIENSRRAPRQFRTWLTANRDRVAGMCFREIVKELRAKKIATHEFLAMD